MPKSRHVGGSLQVGAQIKNIDQKLGMSLRLHIAAHQRHGHHRLVLMQQESRGECIEGPLVRLDRIWTFGVQREQSASVMQYEAEAGYCDSRSESFEIAVDP